MKVEGRNAVRELLKTDKDIDKILVQNGLRDVESKKLIDKIREYKIKVQFADTFVLDKESQSKKHQGFIAFVSEYKYVEVEDIIETVQKKGKEGFIVLLNEVLDPHNLGSIIRVCECAGVDGIIITKNRSASVNDLVMRVSEGALNHVKIARVVNINHTIEKLKEAGYWVMAVELGGDNIYESDLTGNLALVIGGEDSGVKRLTKEKCEKILTIPMKGKVNSLNASVACGVAVFEALRQRN
ncbi:MAG: 23S rRNA (guanosine(2251)-2'-O)-methyltransferase RlmB [Clostridia bacterium]|nr:23S rRNA (guanosine(2251)-2'-O)-methyltransferase RlmB [Clostridia bacterium]